jgi:hypothetical protein
MNPILLRKDSKLFEIAEKILNSLDNFFEVEALPPDHMEAMHYILTKAIIDHPSFERQQWDRVHDYVSLLPRYHRALFWKIFNFFSAKRSETWYLDLGRYRKKILDALMCCGDELEHWAKCQSLEQVLTVYRVVNGTLGMQYDNRRQS